MHNKIIVVTGGATGLGFEIAKQFAVQHGTVIILDLHFDQNIDTFMKDNLINDYLPCDVSNPEQVNQVVKDIADKYGKIDVLINNAGIYPLCDFFAMTPESWKQTIDIDLNSVFYFTQAVSKIMKESTNGGSIINITTIDALHPSDDHAHYCAAKAGVLSLTKYSATILGKYGIRVNAIAPGLINRPTLKDDWPDGHARYLSRAALNHIPEPADIASACLFLASDYAKSITGTEIPIDCGVLSAKPY